MHAHGKGYECLTKSLLLRCLPLEWLTINFMPSSTFNLSFFHTLQIPLPDLTMQAILLYTDTSFHSRFYHSHVSFCIPCLTILTVVNTPHISVMVALPGDIRTRYYNTSGPILDKKCVGLSDPAPFHEMLVRIYFVVKP